MILYLYIGYWRSGCRIVLSQRDAPVYKDRHGRSPPILGAQSAVAHPAVAHPADLALHPLRPRLVPAVPALCGASGRAGSTEQGDQVSFCPIRLSSVRWACLGKRKVLTSTAPQTVLVHVLRPRGVHAGVDLPRRPHAQHRRPARRIRGADSQRRLDRPAGTGGADGDHRCAARPLPSHCAEAEAEVLVGGPEKHLIQESSRVNQRRLSNPVTDGCHGED